MDKANKLAIEANRLAIEGHSPTPKELDLAAKLPVAPEIQIRRTGMHAQTQVQMNLQANRRRPWVLHALQGLLGSRKMNFAHPQKDSNGEIQVK